MNFATRPSALARWQTGWVINALETAWPELKCRQTVIETNGDRVLDRPLPEIGGKGLFTQELENALLKGEVDAAVHSLKDLPIDETPGIVHGAISTRADARDVLISGEGFSLDSLPQGANVGTSSLRRTAQLLAYRPDLEITPVRGNIDTRLRKALEGQYDAIVLAAAGVERLGLSQYVSQWLPFEIMLPAPGQAALAVQRRAQDTLTQNYLEAVDDLPTHLAVTAERSFLAGLGGGCSLPVAAFADINGEGLIHLRGLVAEPDGSKIIRLEEWGREAASLGVSLAQKALESGGGRILATLPSYNSLS
jgi:hydroxymethylbilane synthase